MAFLSTAFLVTIAVSVGLSAAASLLLVPKGPGAGELDFTQQVSMALDYNVPKEVLVGRRLSGGMAAYIDTHDEKNELYVRVQVFSSIPCSNFVKAILNGDEVELSGDPTQEEVLVTSHFLGINSSFNFFGLSFSDEPTPRASLRIFLGEDNSSLPDYLNSKTGNRFNNTDVFSDCCVAVWTFRNTNDDFDEDEGENFIPFQGPPRSSAIFDGVKVCDPRIEGSVYEDRSTYVFSDNPRLIDAQNDFGWYSGPNQDKKIVGLGYPKEAFDLEEIKSSADYCESRGYICAGRIPSGDTDAINEIRKTYNATRAVTAVGVSSIPAGARKPPVVIDLSTLPDVRLDNLNRQGFSPDVINTIRTYYAEPAEQFSQKNLPVNSPQEFLDEDNGLVRERELGLTFCPSFSAAQKLEREELLGSRAAASLDATNLPAIYSSARTLSLGGRLIFINSRIPWVNGVEWIVEGKTVAPNLLVSLKLREYPGDAAFTGSPDLDPPQLTSIEARPWVFRGTQGANPINLLKTQAIQNSFVEGLSGPVLSTEQADGSWTISIPEHTRIYGSPDLFSSVSIEASEITGLLPDKEYRLYYDDETLSETEVSFHATENPSEAFLSSDNPSRHYFGMKETPPAGTVDSSPASPASPSGSGGDWDGQGLDFIPLL